MRSETLVIVMSCTSNVSVLKFLPFFGGGGRDFRHPSNRIQLHKTSFLHIPWLSAVTAKIIFQGINSGLITYFFGQNKRGSLTVDRYLQQREQIEEGEG
jgi:hypothetical protein